MEGAIRVSVVATGIDAIGQEPGRDAGGAPHDGGPPIRPMSACSARRSGPGRRGPRRETPVTAAAPVAAPEEPTLFEGLRTRGAGRRTSSMTATRTTSAAARLSPAAAAAPHLPPRTAMAEDDARPSLRRARRRRPAHRPRRWRGCRPLPARCRGAPPLQQPRPPRAAAPARRRAARRREAALRDRLADQPDGRACRASAERNAAPLRQQPPVTGYDDEAELSADRSASKFRPSCAARRTDMSRSAVTCWKRPGKPGLFSL